MPWDQRERRFACVAAQKTDGGRITGLGFSAPITYLCAMSRRVSSKVLRWRVAQIGGPKAREICELEAKDATAAIKRVIREYGIDDRHRQKRLIAYRAVTG